MANKNQNKEEYVVTKSFSVKVSNYNRYKAHAKKLGFNFSKLLCILFEEDIIAEENAKQLSEIVKRQKTRAERQKMLNQI